MSYVIVLAVMLAVVFVVTAPLRRRPGAPGTPGETGEPDDSGALGARRQAPHQASPEVLDLEAARDAKYREIRDAELDHQTGKLSDADFDAIDSTLRAEAIEILRRLDDATARDG